MIHGTTIPVEALRFFVPACLALNLAFGPNNLRSITIGARHGLRVAMIAAMGRLVVAFAIMTAVAALGKGALLMASKIAFWG